MKKIFVLLLICLLTGCYSDCTSNPLCKEFEFKIHAQLYAQRMERSGYTATVYHRNWYMLGGYPWGVIIKEKVKDSGEPKHD